MIAGRRPNLLIADGVRLASRPEVEAWRSTFAESTCRSTRNPNLLCILAMFAQKRASARLPTARFRSRPHTRTIRPSELGRGAGQPDRRTSTLKPAGGGAARSIPPTLRVSRAGSPAAIGAIGERSQTFVPFNGTSKGKGLTRLRSAHGHASGRATQELRPFGSGAVQFCPMCYIC